MSYISKLLIFVVFGLPVKLVSTLVLEIAGKEKLDLDGKYWVSWKICKAKTTINFEVVAETTGYVGFGLSSNGGMNKADILIAGVYPNGTVYKGDYHCVGNQAPVLDAKQNWSVTKAEQNATHTMLNIRRRLDTEDLDDYKITDDTTRLIWAMGETDDLTYHATRRGTKSVNLMFPNQPSFNTSQYPHLNIKTTVNLTAEETMYWCSIHKMPPFSNDQHIIRFEPIVETEAAMKHIQHFILYRCLVPENENRFSKFTVQEGYQGDHCYGKSSNMPFFSQCVSKAMLITAWGKGGQPINFPDNVGLRLQENPDVREYWGLEVHYDNPQQQIVKNVTAGVRFYYTDQIRQHEAGLMRVDHNPDVSLTIPPNSKDFVISGHCSGECTKTGFPAQGINIFNVLLHSHGAGRKLKLRHFRGSQELEVIAKDYNYDFGFQQSRLLPEARKVLPGDQMTIECTYTTGATAVVGGLTARQEMCQGWFYYYPKVNYSVCGSTQGESQVSLLGITKVRRNTYYYPAKYHVEKPENLKGDYVESVSSKVNWTREFREFYQKEMRFGWQASYCVEGLSGEFVGYVAYPTFSTWKIVGWVITGMGLVGILGYAYKKKLIENICVMQFKLQ